MYLNRIRALLGALSPYYEHSNKNAFCVLMITLSLLVFLSFTSPAQCIAPSMVFKNPTVISGTDKQVGAVYKFTAVTTGVDATIQIMGFSGGAALNDMDNTSQGYYYAWQPYVTAGANGTSYLDWKISFKKAGTLADTALPCLAITAIDIDGDGSSLKEFIGASTPGAYAVDPNTELTVSFDGVNSHAVGTYATVANIDTAARKYMFQMNFSKVSTILYRNGSISNKNNSDVRHTSIYFKPFFTTGLVILSVKLVSFQASEASGGVALQWTATDEKELQHYTVQYSHTGTDWQDAVDIPVRNDGNSLHQYSWLHETSTTGKKFYRLKQVDIGGGFNYSRMVSIGEKENNVYVKVPTVVSGRLPVELITPSADVFTLGVYNMQGALSKQVQYAAQAGNNKLWIDVNDNHAGGMYMLVVRNRHAEVVFKTKLFMQ